MLAERFTSESGTAEVPSPELLPMNRQRRSHNDPQSPVGSGFGPQRRASSMYDHEDSDVTERLIEITEQDPASLDMQRPHSFPLGEECAICFRDVPDSEQPLRQPCNINTLICDECKVEYCREQILHRVPEIECLCNCGTKWSVDFIWQLSPDLYEQHLQQLAEEAVLQDPAFRRCPVCDVGAIYADANADHPRIICVACGETSCFLCGNRWEDDGHTCQAFRPESRHGSHSIGSAGSGGSQQPESQQGDGAHLPQLQEMMERIDAQLQQTRTIISLLQTQREMGNEVLQGFREEQQRLNEEIHRHVWHERLDEIQFSNGCACTMYVVWRCIRVTFEQLWNTDEGLEHLERLAWENQRDIRFAEQERCLQPSGERSLHNLQGMKSQLHHLRSRCAARSRRRWAFMPASMFLEEVNGKLERIAIQVQTINRAYNLTQFHMDAQHVQ